MGARCEDLLLAAEALAERALALEHEAGGDARWAAGVVDAARHLVRVLRQDPVPTLLVIGEVMPRRACLLPGGSVLVTSDLAEALDLAPRAAVALVHSWPSGNGWDVDRAAA